MRIDLSVELEVENAGKRTKHAILIENKYYTGLREITNEKRERRNQLEVYKEIFKAHYEKEESEGRYWKQHYTLITCIKRDNDNFSIYNAADDLKFKKFYIKELLNEANNNNGNAIEAFKQSFEMIKGHFAATLLLLILVFTVSYLIIPNVISSLLLKLPLTDITIKTFKIPSDFSIAIYDTRYLVEATIGTIISSIVVMFTLPMRSITWTLWYKKLLPKYNREVKKSAKKSKVVKLDQRILDRAMEDYE
jgi:hypothetical protein